MKTTNIAAGAAALAAVGLLGAGLSGCSGSVKVETKSTPSVSAADLQKDLSDRLSSAGMTVKSVTCKDDLVGEVGKTAGCDVDFNDTNSVEAVFTATKVEGTTVSFDIAPAMTKDQLQKAVSSISNSPTVTCDSGVEGKVGAQTKCEVTKDGAASKRIAEVSQVDAPRLGLEISVWQVLSKQQLQDLLTQKMAADNGAPPETVDCVDDVVAKKGTVVECSVSSGGQVQAYDVTVTDTQGDTVSFDYAAKP